jgi:hypothetical protein
MKALSCGAFVMTIALLGTVPVGAEGDACSHDTLAVDGSPVEVTLCVPAPAARRGEGKPVSVSVSETFAAGGSSFTRSVALDFLDGAETSRTIDDAPLHKLGIGKSLHLTIAYRAGTVRLEHAMLVPGAISLK